MDHKFSGYSVWLEPDERQGRLFSNKIESLSQRCCPLNSSDEAADMVFAPHCTLLYNIHIKDECKGRDLLIEARDKFRHYCSKNIAAIEPHYRGKSESNSIEGDGRLIITPEAFYYFPYPKEADYGKGFGCLILMILLEKSAALAVLHSIVTEIFPSDERHGEQGGTFQPHLAFCYAAESNTWLEEEKSLLDNDSDSQELLLPFHGKYLTLWKTEGTISQWILIAKIKL